MPDPRKVILFGLDCAPPELIFKKWRKELPILNSLIEKGIHGPLRSSDPPITIPAWSSMLSGKNPAELGFYGFKNRKSPTYFEREFVTSDAVEHARIWDILGHHGKKSLLVGVPQTFPAYPIEGEMVSGFLTPSPESPCTYPEELKEELYRVCPDFLFDVPGYRSENRQEILEKLIQMTKAHFKFFKHQLVFKPWDFAMLVEIGTDRIQHCFWQYMDETHPFYQKGNPFEAVILDYYRLIDREIGNILCDLDQDTLVLVVSDHGAKPMLGAIAINEWLLQKGYLKLKKIPDKPVSIESCEVDWKNTVAWGIGGYYGRIYLNVRGRESEGALPAEEYEATRKKLADEISSIKGVNSHKLNTRTYTAEELYGKTTGSAPDLFVYFDDLNYRCLSSVGTGSVACLQNDTGPDGANHDYHGIFIASAPDLEKDREERAGMHLVDVARTVLEYFEIPEIDEIGGKNLLAGTRV